MTHMANGLLLAWITAGSGLLSAAEYNLSMVPGSPEDVASHLTSNLDADLTRDGLVASKMESQLSGLHLGSFDPDIELHTTRFAHVDSAIPIASMDGPSLVPDPAYFNRRLNANSSSLADPNRTLLPKPEVGIVGLACIGTVAVAAWFGQRS